MKFAHVFIGSEFLPIANSIADQVVRGGGSEYAASVNLYVLDGAKLTQIIPKQLTDIEILRGDISSEDVEVGDFSLEQPSESAAFFTQKVYNSIIVAGGGDSTLYVDLHFPIYKKDSIETVFRFYDVLQRCKRNINCDFIGYCKDVSEIIEPGFKDFADSPQQIKLFDEYKRKYEIGITSHFVAIQCSSQNGAALAFDAVSFAKMLAEFGITCVDHYFDIFPNSIQYEDVVAIGLSKLSLDKYLIIEYLLNRLTMHSIDCANARNEKVDINMVGQITSRLLDDKTKILSSILAEIEKKAGTDEHITEYQSKINAEVDDVIKKLKEEFSTVNDITLKEAIIAAMLSLKCDLFSNTIYDDTAVNYNDLFSESFDYYVENNKKDFYKIDGEPLFNPIARLKEVNNKLIMSKAQAKVYAEALEELEKGLDDAGNVGNCYVEDGVFHYNDYDFRLLPDQKQEPLKETYEAHDVQEKSVDLRSFFTKIKNQGSQGSCLAHAVTSVFEYSMKRGSQKDCDLSEAFLYYNARKLDDCGDVSVNEDKGSRYKPAMDSLAEYGIALERFCPYNENVYTQEPSKEAYEDAAKRKLILAKNVRPSIKDIKSALSDGYPVAGSFHLLESFFKSQGGDIPMPTNEEIEADEGEEKHSYHAMVIVGYSDTLQRFLLRNSWGEEWGDKGYCYIPYAYVEDSRLCDFCCIITDIAELKMAHLEQIPSLQIDDSNMRISYMVKKIELENIQKEISELEATRGYLIEYLEKGKALLINQTRRNDFIASSEGAIGEEIAALKENKNAKEDELDAVDATFKTDQKKLIINTLFKSLLLIVSNVIVWYIINKLYNLLSPIIDIVNDFLSVVGSIFGVESIGGQHTLLKLSILLLPIIVYIILQYLKLHKKWNLWREERDGIIISIKDIEKKIKEKEHEKLHFKVKTLTAWSCVQALEANLTKLHALNNKLVSLINNLRAWYDESSEKLSGIDRNVVPKVLEVSLIDYDQLDRFFDGSLKEMSAFTVDFCEDIDNHEITEEYLKDYK